MFCSMKTDASKFADKITKQSKTSFYYTFLFLPKQKRDAMNTIYSFCRISDDIVDEDLPIQTKEINLREWEANLKAAENQTTKDPYFQKISEILDRFKIPYHLLFDLISGMRMDLVQSNYTTFSDLRNYCYHVASVVGLMCIEIFGYKNEETKAYAEQLGIALQLTNIIRDAYADSLIDRYYIPDEDFTTFNYTKTELRNGVYNEQFIKLMQFQTERAKSYYKKATELLPRKDKKALVVSEMMHKIYYRILLKIEAKHFNVFEGKISLSSSRKLQIASSEFFKTKLGFA